MNTVIVKASREYQVLIGRDILTKLGSEAAKLGLRGRAAIVSDSNVWSHYGQTIEASLSNAGYSVIHFVFPAGEASKNSKTYLDILNFLAENSITRSDFLIALGGGVVGDIAGFTAATYLRGIDYIQIPTTLLAMVDSSVGGKTAIDLPAGKNLVGAFYQPRLVLCDTNTLGTLPNKTFADGCAEVIKYGVLYDAALFSHLQSNGLEFNREYVVSRCVELKRDVVAADEFDRGERQKLNLGHTFGHSIESSSNFTITHGKAVAIGMCIASKAAAAMGICDEDVYAQLKKMLTQFKLPVSTELSADTLASGALSDKKRNGETINLIFPETIGRCCIHPTPVSELITIIKAGL